MTESPDRRPEYGPRGYLPERAAKRARKIMLREPMGLGWPIAAGVAGLLLLVTAVAYYLLVAGPPGPPFVEAGPIERVDPRGAAVVPLAGTRRDALVVRGGGGVEVFAAPDVEATWCPASRRIESPSGRVWALDGQLVGGQGASLQPLRAEVYSGVLYVDPSGDLPVPSPDPSRSVTPTCASTTER